MDYARRGVLVAAISAIDIALWDLRGKLLRQPVSTLLGGRRREQDQGLCDRDVLHAYRRSDLSAKLVDEARLYAVAGFPRA